MPTALCYLWCTNTLQGEVIDLPGDPMLEH